MAQYEKGQSGNKGGRPKYLAEWRKSEEAQRLRDISYKALEEAVTAVDIEWRDKIHAAGMLLDRVEGKAVQAISGPDDGPIQVQQVSFLETLGTLASSDSTK